MLRGYCGYRGYVCGVDHEDDGVGALGVGPPFLAVLDLAAEIPDFHLHALLLNRLNLQADGRNRWLIGLHCELV